jgi:hypothetical protein
MSRIIKHKVGDIIGRLTIVERKPSNKWKSVNWLCLCTCGNFVTVSAANLGRTTKSCGCLKIEKSREMMSGMKFRQTRISEQKWSPFLREKGTAFRNLFQKYKYDARKHLRSFELTPEQFFYITSQPCFYCGDVPSQTSKTKARNVYIFNGIDQKMNDRHYTLENSIPCCWPCNKLKARRNIEEFLAQVKKIARRQWAEN